MNAALERQVDEAIAVYRAAGRTGPLMIQVNCLEGSPETAFTITQERRGKGVTITAQGEEVRLAGKF